VEEDIIFKTVFIAITIGFLYQRLYLVDTLKGSVCNPMPEITRDIRQMFFIIRATFFAGSKRLLIV